MFWGPILRSYFCMNDGNDKTFNKLNLLPPPSEVSLPSVGVASTLSRKGRLWSLVVGLVLGFSQSVKPCLTLCNPMDWTCQASLSITNSRSLLKLMSIELMLSNHASLSRPLPPALSLSQHQGVSSSHQVAKVLEFQLQHQSFQWIYSTDFF